MLRIQSPLSACNPRMNAAHFSHDLAPNACPMMLLTCAHSSTQLRHYFMLSRKLPMQLSHCLARYCAPYLLAFVRRSCTIVLNAHALLCLTLARCCFLHSYVPMPRVRGPCALCSCAHTPRAHVPIHLCTCEKLHVLPTHAFACVVSHSLHLSHIILSRNECFPQRTRAALRQLLPKVAK